MEYKNKKLELFDIQNKTYMNIQHARSMIEHADDYRSDPDKACRLELPECKYCYYLNSSRIGGAAMTSVNCAWCDKTMGFSNTCIDKLCPECAKELKLCRHCGADLDGKKRRKLDVE